jgi:WD40 repeat protein
MADAAATAPRPVVVLYVPADEPFVRGFLLPALGPSVHGEPVIDARDLATTEISALDEALLAGGAAIAVITPAFLTNPWARQSELLASGAAVDGKLEVVPLWLEDCALPPHIRYKVLLDFRDRGSWDALARTLRAFLARPAPACPPLPCPYPGMRPFQADDAKYFYGRDTEIDAVLGLVAAGERELYLIGPSGSGKSSLITAGVLPRLAARPGAPELIVRTMRPGDAPLRRLGECLEAGPTAAPDAAAVAAWSARHPGARLVIFIDQLEELFTQAGAGDPTGFAAALGALRGEPRCLVVLALRADFYAELMQSPLWVDGRRHVDLPPLRGAALRAAIEKPARALDVYFEAGLIDRLLADAAGEPGVLPLLQETLVQLWGRRRERLVTLTAYEALGEGGRSGLAVAISSRADRCLRELTPNQELIAQRLLLRLVSFGEGRPNTRRRQTRAQLAAGEPTTELDAVLQRLVAARLVTMDGDGRSSDPQVDLCHEVLISAWPAFAAWVETRRADELRRRQIQASAEEWFARGRGASGLLDAGELAAAIAWRTTTTARELGESPEVRALIDASHDALTRARSRRRRWLATAFGALAVFAAVTATLAIAARRQADVAEAQRAEAERQRRAAVHMLGEQYREAGRQLVVAGHPQRAIPYLVAARDQGIDDAALRALFHTATASAVRIALHHDGPVTAVEFTADGARVVTASRDGTARVWDAATGAPLTPPLRHPGPVIDARIRGDGARVLTVSGDVVRIWEVTASPPPPIEIHHAATINLAVFSADGARVATASDDRTARLWSVATGQPVIPPLVHDAKVLGVELSPDGTRIATLVSESHVTSLRQGDRGIEVTVREPRGAALWNARTGAKIVDLEVAPVPGAADGHSSLATGAAFSADSRRLVTTGTDHIAIVWDAATGKTILREIPHDSYVLSATFSPDGARIATVDRLGHARLWNAATGEAVKLATDVEAVARITYSRDGTRMLVLCTDKRVRIWDAATTRQLAVLELESGTSDAAITGDGARVATASADGVARIWDIRPALRVLQTVEGAHGAAYSPDGSRIATTSIGGELWLWTASGKLVAQYKSFTLGASTPMFDRSGTQIAMIVSDGTVEIGSAATATLRAPGEAYGKNPTGTTESPDNYGHQPPRGAFSPDGRRFATLAGEHGAMIWDIAAGEPVTPMLSHEAPVLMVRWSPDGRRVITAGEDAKARVWDAATGAAIGAPLGHPEGRWVTAALFTPDGKRIITLCTDNNVRVWDAAGQLQTVLSGHSAYIIGAQISQDSTWLLTHGTDHSARLWNLATGTLAIPPLEHDDWVNDVGLSPEGGRIVTASANLVQVWDARTGLPLAPPFVHADVTPAVMFSPDGASVLSVGSTAIEIWDAGLDTGSLDDWHRLARDSSFPQLGQTVDRQGRP